MSKFTKKDHLKFHKLAASLFSKNESDIKHELAEYEMKHGENFRKEVEFELNLLRREEQYKKEAQIFYDIVSNIGKYPEDYGHFPKIKKEIFKQYNLKKQRIMGRAREKAKKNQKLIEELLLYRIKHMPTRFNPHLMPEKMKGISAEVTMEAERLYYMYKSMLKHHEKHPTSTRFGLSKEERSILEKIRSGYFKEKLEKLAKKQIKERKKKQSVKAKIKLLSAEEEKGLAKEYSKKLWYRKEKLKPEVIEVLKEIGYQETNNQHEVRDFIGAKVACIAFKPGGFKNDNSSDKRESIHHFSRPFLLKELSPSTQILVKISGPGGEERIVDAVVTYYENDLEKKAAIEFQESHKIGPEEFLKKIKPLISAFDTVVVVCEDKHKNIYQSYKNEKYRVVNVSEFKLLLETWGILEDKTKDNPDAAAKEVVVEQEKKQ